jgi:hypothetical protein
MVVQEVKQQGASQPRHHCHHHSRSADMQAYQGAAAQATVPAMGVQVIGVGACPQIPLTVTALSVYHP